MKIQCLLVDKENAWKHLIHLDNPPVENLIQVAMVVHVDLQVVLSKK